MKVGKNYLGKVVEVQWRDPTSGGRRAHLSEAPVGRAALATWREYGVVDNITDGIIRIVHSAGADPGLPPESTDEIMWTVVPEELIERIRVFEPIEATHAAM